MTNQGSTLSFVRPSGTGENAKNFKFGQVTLQSELSDRTGTNFIHIYYSQSKERQTCIPTCPTGQIIPKIKVDPCKFHWNLNENKIILFQGNAFQNVVNKMLSPFCLNVLMPWKWSLFTAVYSGILLGMNSANERRRYIVSPCPEWFLFAQCSWAGVSSRQYYDLIDAVTFVVILWHSHHSFIIFTWKKINHILGYVTYSMKPCDVYIRSHHCFK